MSKYLHLPNYYVFKLFHLFFYQLTFDIAVKLLLKERNMELYNQLKSDVRFIEGLKSCMNCGVCTAICPAAEFFDYDPRVLLTIIQSKDDSQIEELVKKRYHMELRAMHVLQNPMPTWKLPWT